MNQNGSVEHDPISKEKIYKKTHPFFYWTKFFSNHLVLLGRIRINKQKFMKFHEVGFYGRYKWNHNYDKWAENKWVAGVISPL